MIRETTVKTLAALVDGAIQGDENRIVRGINNLASAAEGDVSFLNNESYAKYLQNTKASAVIIHEKNCQPTSAALIIVKDPYLAYAKIATYLTQELHKPTGIHPAAVVSSLATVHQAAHVGPNTIIESGAVVAEGVCIGANCYIGENVTIGADSNIMPTVSIYANTVIGRRAIIHCGSVLGSDGFGLANDAGKWVKIPQIGQLIVGDDVEIGANCTIDRGAIDNTIIHDGVKIDNLVHVAHNVEIGEHTAIAAFVGIAGSTKIGKYCTVAGAAGITGHIEIGDKVHIGGMAMVTKSLKDAGHYSSGIPAEPANQWRRNVVRFRQLDKLEKRIKELENELKLLKGL